MDARLILELWRRLTRLRERERWTRAQLEAHQAKAVRQLREYAYARSPFYQRFHRGHLDRPLAELPVLTKALVMEHFDELVTDRAVRLEAVREHVARASPERRFLGRYWVCATSGSTGQPGLFLFDRSEWIAMLASFARAHAWAGAKISLTHRMRMAAVASTNPWHLSAQVTATLRGWWMPTLRLDAAQPLETIVQRLNAFQPGMLVAYPSTARVLADEQLAGHLRIAPYLVFTSGEVLTPETRRRIGAAWGRQPFDQYGATESGNLAAECERHAGLHLMEDLALVEVVDERHRPVPPGAYGEKVLVTVFASRTLPLIRYELSDSLRLARSPCACGLPFILVEDVQGRLEDVLRFPSATGGEVAVHPNTFHHLLDTLPVTGWQVIQEQDGGLTVLLSGAADGMDARLAPELRQALVALGALPPPVRIHRVASIPTSAAGKAPLIRSHRAGTGAPTPTFGRPPESAPGDNQASM
jgi:phenylacetate-CoA ligase